MMSHGLVAQGDILLVFYLERKYINNRERHDI